MLTTTLTTSLLHGRDIGTQDEHTFGFTSLAKAANNLAHPLKSLVVVTNIPHDVQDPDALSNGRIVAVACPSPPSFIPCTEDFDLILLAPFTSFTPMNSIPAPADPTKPLPPTFSIRGNVLEIGYREMPCLLVEVYGAHEPWNVGLEYASLSPSPGDLVKVGDEISFDAVFTNRLQLNSGKLLQFRPYFLEINGAYYSYNPLPGVMEVSELVQYPLGGLARFAHRAYEALEVIPPTPSLSPPSLSEELPSLASQSAPLQVALPSPHAAVDPMSTSEDSTLSSAESSDSEANYDKLPPWRGLPKARRGSWAVPSPSRSAFKARPAAKSNPTGRVPAAKQRGEKAAKIAPFTMSLRNRASH